MPHFNQRLYRLVFPSTLRRRIHNFILRQSGIDKEVANFEERISSLTLEMHQQLNSRENRIHPYVREALNTASISLRPVEVYSNSVEENELGRSFDKYGSDKNERHSYAHIYEQILDGIESPHILEIGLGSLNPFPYAGLEPGGSLKAWRERYPGSIIVGGDIDPEAVEAATEKAFQIDQTDPGSLDNFASSISSFGPFDLIVDDGFHDPHANILTAIKMLPLLRSTGSYVVEDVHSSLIDLWRVLLAATQLDGSVIDMSELRPNTDDNVLILIKSSN